MKYYLGIDGGGTKTGFLLIDHKGNICAYFKGDSCHYKSHGFDQFRAVIKNGLHKVTEQAQITVKEINYAFLGIPCYGEYQEDIPRLQEITGHLLENNFSCGNDVEAAWAGSLACQPGINIVAGTGAIGFGRDHFDNRARASGWGYFCGDEGSGYWLGKKLISLFTKQADGRLEKTALYQIVRDEFSLKDDFELIGIINEKLARKRKKIAQLAPLLDRAASKGDSKILEIYDRAAQEHSLTVKAIIDKLEFKNKEITVSYSGGVFKAGDLILKPFEKYLKQQEGVVLKPPALKPVTGAAFYALLLDQKAEHRPQVLKKLQKQETNWKQGIANE